MKCTYKEKIERILASFKTDEKKFHLLIIYDILLFFLSSYFTIFFVYIVESNVLTTVSVFLTLVICTIIFFVLMRSLKQDLTNIAYTYRNLYLFRRYNYLYEVLIGASLSFLLAISPSLLGFIGITNESIMLSAKICLTALSCIATGTRATLSYAYITWDADNKKKGESLADIPSADSTTKAKKQSNARFLHRLLSILPFGKHRK